MYLQKYGRQICMQKDQNEMENNNLTGNSQEKLW